MDDEEAVDEVYVSPSEREQFAEAQPRISCDAVQLGVLQILTGVGGKLRIVVGQPRDLTAPGCSTTRWRCSCASARASRSRC